jgi:hypothetical protein
LEAVVHTVVGPAVRPAVGIGHFIRRACFGCFTCFGCFGWFASFLSADGLLRIFIGV